MRIRDLNRRQMMTATLGASGLLTYPALGRAQSAHAAAGPLLTEATAPFVTVETANGVLRGGHIHGALGFRGIPYAGSVTGANRFKMAPPPASWTGVRDALHPGPPTIQPPGGTYGEQEPAYSEDCLVLNVWTPAVNDGRKRPVLFYNHGGGFLTGSGSSVDADGANMAREYDVVVVASNHRLGVLGYLYLGEIGGEAYASSGNAGMLDIVAALTWVNENIEAFGGDPGNVMIFGESGGGQKTSTLCAMPAARGLFHKIGVISGPYLRATPKADATALAQAILAKLEIAPDQLDRLADVPLDKLLEAQTTVHIGPTGPGFRVGAPHIGLGPVFDGTYVAQNPFDPAPAPWIADMPLVIGLNNEEARFFAMAANKPEIFTMDDASMVDRVRREFGDAVADQVLPVIRRDRPNANPTDLYIALADAEWWMQSIEVAERKSAQSAPVFMYRYDYESNHPIPGTDQVLRAAHATDIAADFDNPDATSLMGSRPDRAQMAHIFSELWATFARTGRPGAAGQPVWPPYEPQHRSTMVINLTCQVEDDPHQSERVALFKTVGAV